MSELRDRSRDSRLTSRVTESGTDPEKELDRSARVLRLIREEIEVGIGPKKWLSERSRVMS